ncbi:MULTISPECIES: hypothetical protein [unclassified Streptomyces]|uniref:hypothetical protein n=1 Tax=unclassified Streptomyces TaxID=2593676 RepID=UPI00380B1EC2
MALVGVAVTAVSGCVSVEPRPAPGPVTRPEAADATPAPVGTASRIAQAPGREALEAVPPVPAPEPTPSGAAEARRAAPAPAPAAGLPAPTGPPAPAPWQRSDERPVERPPAALPSVSTVAGLCALAETYGGWSKDSPQAQVCREAYSE